MRRAAKLAAWIAAAVLLYQVGYHQGYTAAALESISAHMEAFRMATRAQAREAER